MNKLFPRLLNDAVRFEDARGWLAVLYESDAVVMKRSFSRAGVFRGLHIQRDSSPQVKLIRVIQGRIIDIIVDKNDPERTIHQSELRPEDEWVRIDAHFAHGFLATEDTLFEYVCDGGYDEASEQAYSITAWLEQQFGAQELILSDKDRKADPL
jgi:dTDP-4-dehydrorhamnose 3,5-epimerase